jgi:hypothetical protein
MVLHVFEQAFTFATGMSASTAIKFKQKAMERDPDECQLGF